MKKIVSLILSIICALTITIPVLASEKGDYDWTLLSQQTGISVIELQKSQERYDSVTFNGLIDQAKKAYSSGFETKSRSRGAIWGDLIEGSVMNDSEWASFKQRLYTGSILVSKDSIHVGFRHGHSAIVNLVEEGTSSGANRYIDITQAIGPNVLSARNSIDDSAYWRKRYTLRAYLVKVNGSVNTTSMGRAGSSARTNLVLNKSYAALPTKDDANYLNCATLVYRCYKAVGVDLLYNVSPIISYTVMPQDLDNSPSTTSNFTRGPWL